MRYGQTMTFTTLMMFQLFNALNARSDEESAFCGLFRNRWLWAAIALSLFLHAAVVYPSCRKRSRLAASTPAIGFSARRSQVLYCGSAN